MMGSMSPRPWRARTRLISGVAFGLLLAGCDNSAGTGPRVARVEVNLGSPTLLVGTNAAALARAFDLGGTEVTGVRPTWRSSAPAVVSVDNSGILTAKTLGSATISATVGGVTGNASLTVVPVPVASVTILPVSGTIDRGQALQLRSEVRNQFGELLTDRTVTWVSSAPGIASVTSSGLVNGIAAGDAVITAASEGQSALVTISVSVTPVPGGPNITGISPSFVAPGSIATISGTNFGAGASENEVRVEGVLATVLNASPTQLTVQLGTSGYGCEPTRQVYVQVLRLNLADARLHPLQSVAQRTLQPGESLILSNGADARCFELSATGGRYLLSVYNTSTSVGADTALRLHGARGIVPPDIAFSPVLARTAPPAAAQVTDRMRFAPADFGALLGAVQQRAERDAHMRLLDANMQMLRDASRSMLQAPAARGAIRANVTANQPVGSIVQMKIPNVGGFLTGGLDYCRDNFLISARVVYNGTKGIVLEDTAAPLAGQMDTLYQKVGQEFDDLMYDIDRNNFGDPLRMDDVLDANGKIIMLFSSKINSFASIAGFVVTCDFESPTLAPSSNHAEVFYAIVPTDTGNDVTKNATRAGWYRTIRSTIVHEVKHLAAFANRIRDFGGSLEENWLEEGTARHAEELWARVAAYGGLQQRANATYAATLFCDVRPANASAPQCGGKPYAMVRHFESGGLYDYLRDNEQRSPLGPKMGIPESSFYGSAWSLVRWAIDNTAADESQFLGALVRTSQSGVSNLSARVGRPWEEFLGEWSLAMYLDDLPGFTSVNNPRLTFPSWNLRSVFAGLNQDFPGTFNVAYPLVPRNVSFGDFDVTVVRLAGGSFAMFQLTGQQAGRQLIQLLNPNGGDPGSRLRVAIVRLE